MPSKTVGAESSRAKRKKKMSMASPAPDVTQMPEVTQVINMAQQSQGPKRCTHNSTAHGPGIKGNDQLEASSSKKNVEMNVGDRRFNAESEYPSHFTLKDMEIDLGSWVCLACSWSVRKCPKCKQHDGHEDTLVIAIHGECINDKAGMRSAFGLFYGHGNVGNISLVISGKDNQTKQIAELNACLRALRNLTSILDKRSNMMRRGNVLMPLNTFVIKSDSEYLVRSLTEWLPKWKKNGWKTCKGVPVANAEKFELIEAGIALLEKVVQVKFWLVPKENNMEASFLAKAALMGI